MYKQYAFEQYSCRYIARTSLFDKLQQACILHAYTQYLTSAWCFWLCQLKIFCCLHRYKSCNPYTSFLHIKWVTKCFSFLLLFLLCPQVAVNSFLFLFVIKYVYITQCYLNIYRTLSSFQNTDIKPTFPDRDEFTETAQLLNKVWTALLPRGAQDLEFLNPVGFCHSMTYTADYR